MCPYPVNHLFYEDWKEPAGYLASIRQALNGVRVTADELQVVLTEVREKRDRLAPTVRWMRRNVWLRRALAFGIVLVTFVAVTRGFPRFDQSVSPLLAAGSAAVLAAFAVLGFVQWLSAGHRLPIDLNHRPDVFTGPERDALRWDRAFGEAERLLEAGILLRRDWESRGPPDGYGQDPGLSSNHG